MVISVAAIEGATGLKREVIRKWETRYGFPRPRRDARGERVYPVDQVASLRLIRRLLDAGLRPAKIVGLDLAALESLARTVAPPSGGGSAFETEALAILRRHDVDGLRKLFQQQIAQGGLRRFVQDNLARMNVTIGEAWFRGELRIFEEHLYTGVVEEVLNRAAATLLPATDPPRILLTTPIGELHVLGMKMAKLFFRSCGVQCIALGAQTPVPEICEAAEELDIDIVGLSISLALPVRAASGFVKELGARLRPGTAIWVGGAGAARLPRHLPRIVPIPTFDAAQTALDALRSSSGG